MDLTKANGTILFVNNSNQSTIDLQRTSAFIEASLIYDKVATGFSAFGIYGNLVSVHIFWTNRRWQHPCTLYLFALAFADIGVIFWRGLLGGYIGNLILKLLTSSDGFCKINQYMWQASAFTSSWLIVAYSVERFTAIIKPHWFRKVSSRHAKITIGLIVCLAFILFIPLLIVFRLRDVYGSRKRQCSYDPGASGQETLAFLLTFGLNYALPCVFLVVLNVFIIRGLGRQNKMTANSMRSNSNNKMRSRKITMNLVFISFLYLLVALPLVIVWSIYCFNFCGHLDGLDRTHVNTTLSRTSAPIKTNVGLSDSDLFGLGRLFFNVSVLNNCFNFVCYSMNLDFFREKFLRILTCGLYKNKRHRNPPLAPENVEQYCSSDDGSSDDGILALPLRQIDPVGRTEVITSV